MSYSLKSANTSLHGKVGLASAGDRSLCWLGLVGPVLSQGRQENQSQSKRSERLNLEDAMLLALKVE